MKITTWPIVLSLANTWSASAVADNVNITAEHAAEAAASAIKASVTISTASQNIPGMPTDLADARAATSAGDYTSRMHHQPRFQCPRSCREAGSNAIAWYNYGIGDLNRLKACGKAMLLNFALFNELDVEKPPSQDIWMYSRHKRTG
jgi:hypothetical protein